MSPQEEDVIPSHVLKVSVGICLTWQLRECQCNANQLQAAVWELGNKPGLDASSGLHYAGVSLEEQNESRHKNTGV